MYVILTQHHQHTDFFKKNENTENLLRIGRMSPLLLFISLSLARITFCLDDYEGGYLIPDQAFDQALLANMEAAEAKVQQTLECPSDNVITTRYRCKVGVRISYIRKRTVHSFDFLGCNLQGLI